MAIGSKIELGRIALYVFFPVAVFFYYNLPESYEDFMSQKKKEIYPADEDCHRPPTNLEDLKKARLKMMEERKKEWTQSKDEVEQNRDNEELRK